MSTKLGGLRLCYFLQGCYGAASQGRFTALLLKTKLNLSDSQIGRLLSVYYMSAIISNPVCGYVADEFLGRRIVFMSTTILSCIFFLSYNSFQYLYSVNSMLAVAVAFLIRFFCAFFASANSSLLNGEALTMNDHRNDSKLVVRESAIKPNHEIELGNTDKITNNDSTIAVEKRPLLNESKSQAEDDQKKFQASEEHKKSEVFAQWGQSRTFASIGWGFCSLVIGILFDLTNNGSVLYYLSLALAMVSAASVYKNFDPFIPLLRKPLNGIATDTLTDLKEVRPFKTFIQEFSASRQRIVFILTIFFSASAMVLVEGLVFLYFVEDLNLSYTVCGISVMITIVFEIPIFHFANAVVQKVGIDGMMVFGMMCYIIRVGIYTIIEGGPQRNQGVKILAVEWMHGFTIAAIQTARTLKVNDFAPKGYETTFQGICNGIAALGSFIGEILGSYLFDTIGKRWTYRLTVLVVSINCLVYAATSTEIKLAFPWNGFSSRIRYIPVMSQPDKLEVLQILPALVFAQQANANGEIKVDI